MPLINKYRIVHSKLDRLIDELDLEEYGIKKQLA